MREAFSIIAGPVPFGAFLAIILALVLTWVLLRFAGWQITIARQASRAVPRDLAPAVRPVAAWTLKEAEEARDRAEAASAAKSRRLATMSHEIRTPLNGILGMAELLGSTELDPEQKSYVEAICGSGAALTALIDEILDIAKIEAGKFELTQAPFDPVDLVEGVVELLAPQAHGKGLEIASLIDPALAARVVGDAARLRQVLINLAGNAIKFTTKGGVGLRVAAAANHVEFVVIDTGPGIPPESRETIFEEFVVAGATPAPAWGSTGLGLAISRRLVEHMGGQLELAASSDAGSTFVTRIPLPPETGAVPVSVPADLRGRRALLVARSRFEAPYLAEQLGAAGVEVLWAGSEEASRVFLRDSARAGRPPEIAIVDCALGMAVTRALGEAARAAGVGRSFVFFSPSERRAFDQNAVKAFDGWLVKPLRSRSLYARLAAPLPPVSEARAASHAQTVDLRDLQVLVAEDNDINALIVVRHLEKCGAHVQRVGDGAAAVAAAAEGLEGRRPRFDAVLLDIRMPGLDGLEAARRIRRAEKEAGAAPSRLVALSADAFDAAVAAARAAGIDAFLRKPVNLASLDRALLREGPISGSARASAGA